MNAPPLQTRPNGMTIDALIHFGGRHVAQMLIGGELVGAQSGKTMPVRNPANGETVGEIPRGSASEVDAAVTAAAKALPGWASTPGIKRAQLMHEAASKMRAVVDEVAQHLSKVQG